MECERSQRSTHAVPGGPGRAGGLPARMRRLLQGPAASASNREEEDQEDTGSLDSALSRQSTLTMRGPLKQLDGNAPHDGAGGHIAEAGAQSSVTKNPPSTSRRAAAKVNHGRVATRGCWFRFAGAGSDARTPGPIFLLLASCAVAAL